MSQTTDKDYIEITDSGKISVIRPKLFKSEEFKNLIKSLMGSSIAKKIRDYKEQEAKKAKAS